MTEKGQKILEDAQQGGALNGEQIRARLTSAPDSERIYLTPMVNSKEQIGFGALDVRLGTEFIIFKRTKYSLLDVCEGDAKDIGWKIGRFQEKVFVPLGKKLILHPQQLVLGSTLEYLKMPKDLTAEVIGRSSWGRLGLIISAATLVHPGYTGVVTLELANEGDTPIALYPGIRIAQLIFLKILPLKNTEKLYTSKYSAAVEPSFSLLHEDLDLNTLRAIVNEGNSENGGQGFERKKRSK
jgi:dCTP deaminase